jgi:hypothetical protein
MPWLLIAAAIAAAAGVIYVASAAAAKSGPLSIAARPRGGIVNGKITGDWILVPKGLVTDDRLKLLHPVAWTSHMNGHGPLSALAKWRKKVPSLALPMYSKVPWLLTSDGRAYPAELNDRMSKEYGAWSGSGGQAAIPGTGIENAGWQWSLDAAPLGLTCFPPAAGFLSAAHAEAWIRHLECWLGRGQNGWWSFFTTRLDKGLPKTWLSMPDTGEDHSSGRWAYFTPSLKPGQTAWSGRRYPVSIDEQNLPFLWQKMCMVLAYHQLLPTPKDYRMTQVSGAKWDAHLAMLQKVKKVTTQVDDQRLSGPVKGMVAGAGVLAGMTQGGPAFWGKAAGGAIKGLINALSADGPSKTFWHDAFSPVAIPRAVLGCAKTHYTSVQLEEWEGQTGIKKDFLLATDKPGVWYDPQQGGYSTWVGDAVGGQHVVFETKAQAAQADDPVANKALSVLIKTGFAASWPGIKS